jgi:hypothetical protein
VLQSLPPTVRTSKLPLTSQSAESDNYVDAEVKWKSWSPSASKRQDLGSEAIHKELPDECLFDLEPVYHRFPIHDFQNIDVDASR